MFRNSEAPQNMEKFTSEIERNPVNAHIFFEMSRGEDVVLAEKIEKHNGLVRVFVHPAYEEYSKSKHIKERDSRHLREVEEAFCRVLASQSEQLPPLFIFEGGYNLEEFEKEEKRLGQFADVNDIYIIRSRPTNPAPLYPDRTKQDKRGYIFLDTEEKEEGSSMWSLLIEELKRLGVKKVFVAGLELYVSEDKENREAIAPGGCVGEVVKHLRGKFEIEYSRLTWPDQIHKQ